MQRMKTYTAAPGIVYGISKKMIDIHQHSGNHDHIGGLPLFSEKQKRHDCRDDKMQCNVDAGQIFTVLFG